MSQDSFTVTIGEHIAHISLNRPDKLNSLLPKFWDELSAALQKLAHDRHVRVLVLSAAGKHFSSGADLLATQAFQADPKLDRPRQNEKLLRYLRHIQRCMNEIDRIHMPVIAAIQGGCMGNAFEMAAACDMRFATKDAFFALPQIKIGVVPYSGALQRLPGLMPTGLARELVYTGRRMGAQEAWHCGLVNQLFETQEDMLEHVDKTAREIAAKSPLALTGAKENLNYARDHSPEQAFDYMALWMASMMVSADLTEGLSAQQQKRAPKFDDLL